MRVDSITRSKPTLPSPGRIAARSKKHFSGWSRGLLVTLFGALVISGLTVWKVQQAQALVSASKGGASSHAGHTVRQPTALSNGLVAWYQMNGSAADSSGQGHNGTLTNFTFDTTTNGWVNGKFGQSLLFGGAQKYMTASDAGLPSGASPRTLSAWVNVPVLPTSCTNETVIAYGSVGAGLLNGLQIQKCSNTDQLVFSGYGADVLVAKTLAINTWNLLTGTYDGTTASLYLNGQLIGSGAKTWNTTLQNINVGRLYNSALETSVFNGSVDDVRIYNRSLSVAEIGQIYTGSQPVNCDQSCAAWWKLDETSGTIAKDSTVNANTGTLANFTFDGITNGWVGGVFKNSLLFNGSTTVVNVPNSASLNLAGPMSITAWFNMNTVPAGGQIANILTKTAEEYYVRILGSGTGGCTATACVDFGSNANPHVLVPVASLPTGAWHYATGTYDGTNYCVYLDGSTKSCAVGAAPASATDALVIGGNAGRLFNGTLDDLRIYSRALTLYEIYEQYSAGR